MKRLLAPALLVGFAVGTASISAQPTEVGPYVRTALGASFVQNTSVDEFYGPVPGGSMKLDTGVRFDVDVGYSFNRYLAAEMEFGWTYNSISSVSGLEVSSASFGNFPFLVNLVLQLPLANGRLIPYIGGGGGGSVASIDANIISNGTIAVSGSDTDLSYAYQGFAGIRYAFNDSMSVGLIYKYLGTGSTSYFEGIPFPSGASGSLELGSTATQSVQATFTFRF